MPDLNYAHLRYFRAVAHDGSLTRAAGRLAVSQSAVSTQLRMLEARLGHALFDRHGRALHLTEAGRIALDHADAIFATGDELLATLGGRAGRAALRVGALATLSRNVLLGFVRPLIGRGDVEVVLRSGTGEALMADLDALRLDVVLTSRAPGGGTGRRLHRVGQQPVALVGRPGLCPPGPDLADRLRAPLILPSPSSGVRMQFDALADRLGVVASVAAEVDDMAMMRLLVRDGAGLGVLPPVVVRDELASGALIEVATLPGLVETFYGVTVARRFPNPLLAEILGEAMEATDAAGGDVPRET